jgi:hypothetical protein
MKNKRAAGAKTRKEMGLPDDVREGVRSQQDVARIMTERGFPMGRSNVYWLEKSALRKLRDGLIALGVCR